MTVHRLPDPQRPIPDSQPHARIHPADALGSCFVEFVGAPHTRGREDRSFPTRSSAVAHAADIHERYGVPIVDWSRRQPGGAAP